RGRDGRSRTGRASAPALGGRRWWASRGLGAFADGRPIHVSKVSRLEDAQLSYGGLSGWRRAGLLDRFIAMANRCWRTRGFGDFWMHLLVAEGSADVAATKRSIDRKSTPLNSRHVALSHPVFCLKKKHTP